MKENNPIRPYIFKSDFFADERKEGNEQKAPFQNDLLNPLIFEDEETPLIYPLIFEDAEESKSPDSEAYFLPQQNMPNQADTIIFKETSMPFVPATEDATPVINVSEKAATPMQIMETLIERVPFLSVSGGLYFFNGIIYKLLTREQAHYLIVHHCRKAVEEHGSPNIVKQIHEFVRMEPRLICDKPADTQHLLAFKNGVLDLQTGYFEPPSPRHFITSYLNVNYVPGASEFCPNFENYLSIICNGDSALYVRIWEMLGYLLTQDMKAKAFFFLFGPSDTGKSVFGRFLSSFFPAEAIANVDLYKLGARFTLAGLVGKRLNMCLDLPSGKLKASAVSTLKLLTGGDTLTAEPKFADIFSFENTCKFIFASNHKLILPEADEAFENRIVAIPFTKVIPKETQDKNLLAKFEDERLAITLKALRFYKQLVSNNYRFSGSNHTFCGSKPEVISSEHDSINDFVEKCCVFTDFSEGTFTYLLHKSYLDFCVTADISPCRDMKQFSKILHEICGERIRWKKWRDARYSNSPENGYLGIALK